MHFISKILKCSLLLAVLISAESCRTVPITGRSQFMFSSDSREQSLGLKEFTAYKKKYKKSTNASYNAALARCGKALTAVVQEENYAWEFIVFDTKEQNAFCLPGGKIAVYSGIMTLMNNEAELSFVVAHEIAHAIARHYGERSSWSSALELGGTILAAGVGGESASDVSGLFNTAGKVGVILPFSRSNEYEADKIGMILMARAGYNPEAAIQFWSRFTKGGGNEKKLSDMMSTHPRDADRIAAMREVLPSAHAEYQKCRNKRGFGPSL